MVIRMPTHCGDDTTASCVVAGDTIYLAHHGGGQDKADIVHQVRAAFESMRRTLESVGASLDDLVQVNKIPRISGRAPMCSGSTSPMAYRPG